MELSQGHRMSAGAVAGDGGDDREGARQGKYEIRTIPEVAGGWRPIEMRVRIRSLGDSYSGMSRV